MKKIFLNEIPEDEQDDPMQEVKVLKGISHPNIIRYYETIKTDEELMIIMDYAE